MTDRKTSVALVSLGCDKNLVESETLLGALDSALYSFTTDESKADIIVVNTCGFIQPAAEEARERIGAALAYKAAGSCKAVVVTGCLAQRYKERLSAEFPSADAVAVTTDEAVRAITAASGKQAPASTTNYGNRILSTPKHYAYLKIAEGCDNRCAYCAIPLIKGPYRSRSMEELAEEAAALAKRGVKELILVAQDTALYGADLYGAPSLDRLLRRLSEIPGVRWLRILYCYPEHITPGLIAEIAHNPAVCKYIDMPIQHADSGVLSRMGRKMGEEGLRKLINSLRGAIPDIALRTTVLVGFPGETDRDFDVLLAFLNDVGFDRLGAFAFSREEGTPAYDYPDQVPEKVKNRRRDRVMSRQAAISAKKQKLYIGKTIPVIIDGYDAEAELYYGRGQMDSPDIDGLVYIEAESLVTGDIYDILITDAFEYDLAGCRNPLTGD